MRERERLTRDREVVFQRRTCWDWVLLQERDSMREEREIQWAHREIEHREGWEAVGRRKRTCNFKFFNFWKNLKS